MARLWKRPRLGASGIANNLISVKAPLYTCTYIHAFHIPILQHLCMIYNQNISPQQTSDINTTNTLFNE